MTSLELAEIHAHALFVHDKASLLTAINEPTASKPPRFFLARTSAGNLWRFASDVTPRLARGLEDLARREPTLPVPPREPHRLAEYMSLLASHAAIEDVWTGPAYVVPEPAFIDTSRAAPLHRLCHVDASSSHVLDTGFAASKQQLLARQPLIASLDPSGGAVCVCYSARVTDRAHEAGVETLPTERGKGHARRAVAAWAGAVRRLGRLPLYSTSWDNAASLGVARSLGMQSYAVTFSVT